MKILVAIESSENPKTLAATTLRWAARAGYDIRIFVPDDSQTDEYQHAIDDANYKWYLDLKESIIVSNTRPLDYAHDNGYDLILYLEDSMHKWKRDINHELNVYEYAKDVGEARMRFNQDSNKDTERFANGAIMERA